MYDIIRHFQRSNYKYRVHVALTLEQAQAHCRDPETSSSTCTSAEGNRRTRRSGPWFDGYTDRTR